MEIFLKTPFPPCPRFHRIADRGLTRRSGERHASDIICIEIHEEPVFSGTPSSSGAPRNLPSGFT